MALSLFLFCIPLNLYASKVALLPIKTPHFNKKQQQNQMKTLVKQLNQLGGFEIIPIHLVDQVNQEIPGHIDDPKRQKELCETLQAELLIYTEMKLATQSQPAFLNTQVIDCFKLLTQKRNLSFVGKLNQDLWSQACEQIEQMITQINQQLHLAKQNQQEFYPPNDINQQQQQQHQIDHPNQFHQEQDPSPSDQTHYRLSRFLLISGGISFFNQTLSYQTSPKSRLQKSGIDFQSQWFTGYQLQVKLLPLMKIKNSFKTLSLDLDYQAYQFESIQIIPIPKLFGSDEFSRLNSSLSSLRYGFSYAYPIQKTSVTHLLGIAIYGFQQSIEIGPNLDYRGHHYRYMQLQLFGQLSAANNKVQLGLDAYFIPFVSFDKSIREFGAQNQSIGGGFRFYMQYVVKNLITLGLQINATLLSHQFSGEGRDGRIGLSASEQALQAAFSLGLIPF